MGFAPAEDPEVLVYVVIDTPDCEEYDTSWSAQMVAADIMHKLVPYLGILQIILITKEMYILMPRLLNL